MSDRLKIVLHGTSGDLAAKAFLKVVRETLWVLEDLSRESSKGPWLIGELSRTNPASVELWNPTSKEGHVSQFVEGVRQLSKSKERPPGFSENALGHMRTLVGVLHEGIDSVAYVNGGIAQAFVSHSIAETIDRVKLPSEYTAYTELEGKLEQINVHGGAEFRIYDPLTDKPVVCKFDARHAEKIGRLLTHRVRVSGMTTFTIDDEPTKIDVDEWEEIGADAITTRELHLAGLKLADDRPSEEIIRELRRLDG